MVREMNELIEEDDVVVVKIYEALEDIPHLSLPNFQMRSFLLSDRGLSRFGLVTGIDSVGDLELDFIGDNQDNNLCGYWWDPQWVNKVDGSSLGDV